MLQTQCVRIPVLEGKASKLRSWISRLSERRSEVLDALATEGIADEAVLYRSEPAGDCLYLYTRAEDVAAAAAAFEASDLPIDREFKEILAECLDFEGAEPLEVLFAADRRDGQVSTTP